MVPKLSTDLQGKQQRGSVLSTAVGDYCTQEVTTILVSSTHLRVFCMSFLAFCVTVNSLRGGFQTRARQVRSALVFQAVWRGRCTRANVSQVRAARRRELEEINKMHQEHQLAARLAAHEANQKEEERINQAKEQSAMRYERNVGSICYAPLPSL